MLIFWDKNDLEEMIAAMADYQWFSLPRHECNCEHCNIPWEPNLESTSEIICAWCRRSIDVPRGLPQKCRNCGEMFFDHTFLKDSLRAKYLSWNKHDDQKKDNKRPTTSMW